MFPSWVNRIVTRRAVLKGLAAGALTQIPIPALAADAGESAWVYNPSGVRLDGRFVDELLKQNMDEQGLHKPPLAGQFPKLKVEKIAGAGADVYTTVNDLFYRRGWTDGLPIVPPTEERVEAMLRGTDLTPDTVVGLIEPMKGQATVSKIAVNAVMAGCRPEYMPILIAAAEILSDQGFDLLGVSTTTNPDTPMVIVSGPIAKQLNINCEANALGRGWQANAAIGRAVHLIVNNVGGSWPGVTDMSCLGHPGEFAMCLAENQDKNPWTTLHVDLGHARDANVVTVVPAESMQNLVGIGFNSEGYLGLISDYLAGLERTTRNVVLVFIASDTAGQLARDGWTKDKVKQYILDHARMPFAKYKAKFIDTNKAGAVPDSILKTTDPNALVPMPIVNELTILVSGGTGEKSMVIPVWGSYKKLLSRPVKLPANWHKLLDEAAV